MRKLMSKAGLLVGCAAIAAPALAATWQGTSVGVLNADTGEQEYYTVRFTLDDSAAKFVTPLTAQDPDHTPFTRALYENVTAFSVTGPNGTIGFDSGTSYVSTLAPALAHYGSIPFLVVAGTDGISAPGYQLQFSYTPRGGYGSTALPGSLDIGGGAEDGFNLLRFDYDGDPAEGIIGEGATVLNFRFASGGFVQQADAAVPEPATWGMMIVGFGLSGLGLRRRRRMAVPA